MSAIIVKLAVLFCLTISLSVLFLPNELLARVNPSPAAGTDPHRPPPPPPETPPPAPANSPPNFRRVALEKFLFAYVEAASAPDPATELGFFADRVDYLGQPGVSQDQIRSDLKSSRERWPERRLQRNGLPTIEAQPNGKLQISLPLHFEFRNGQSQSSGNVVRILVIEQHGARLFRIVGVSERKAAD